MGKARSHLARLARITRPGLARQIEDHPLIYGEMVRKMAQGEIVRILVNSKAEEKSRPHLSRRARGANLKRVEFILHPTNRGWTRDSGPIFVTRKKGSGRNAPTEKAIVHFHFNAWAKYSDWQKDRRVPETAAKVLGKRLFNAECNGRDFVLEGGGIEVNGRGTVLTTEECYLDPKVQVRNPGLNRKERIDEPPCIIISASKMFCWLAVVLSAMTRTATLTTSAVSSNAKTLVLVKEKITKDVNYRPLAENWDRIGDLRLEDGSKPRVIALPMPAPLYFDGVRLPASYANFYICNAAVIVPTFNDPNDRIALGILGELFKDRPVVGIHAVDLVWGFGSLHCLTQQQPA